MSWGEQTFLIQWKVSSSAQNVIVFSPTWVYDLVEEIDVTFASLALGSWPK
jgi:hypothetical protein